MKRFFIASAIMMALFGISTSYAAEAVKIGVVNVQQIVQKSPQMAKIAKTLKNEFKPREEKIVKLQKSLQAAKKKMERNGAVMSNKDRSALQDKIISEQATLRGLATAFQRDLSNEQNAKLQALLNKIRTIVSKVAKQDGYTVVFQKQGLAYSASQIDLTDQVLAKLKKQA